MWTTAGTRAENAGGKAGRSLIAKFGLCAEVKPQEVFKPINKSSGQGKLGQQRDGL